MPTPNTLKPTKKRTEPKLVLADAAAPRTFATHEELLNDMDAFRQRVSANPDAARAFLVSAGLLTKNGHLRSLIRG